MISAKFLLCSRFKTQLVNLSTKLLLCIVYQQCSSTVDVNGTNVITNNVRRILLEPCDITKHFFGYEEYFSHLNISNYKCFVPGQNLQISGRIGDKLNGFKQLTVYVNKCNSTMFKWQK